MRRSRRLRTRWYAPLKFDTFRDFVLHSESLPHSIGEGFASPGVAWV